MAQRNGVELLLLAAIWGASFLFMRMGAAEFGPLALVLIRVGGAAALLLPLLMWRGEGPALRRHWRAIAVVGLVNSALPFLLFAVAALVLTTALMSVFNATAPIWAALVGRLWLGERLTPSRLLGLAIGLAGVLWLSWGKADFKAGVQGVSPALGLLACLAAAVLYGVGANVSRRHLAGVPPMAVAAGSQAVAALAMIGPGLWAWPLQAPGAVAWTSAVALSLMCTGLAYVLYFRLIAHAGTSYAVSVTFLIPAFALLWGWVALGEQPTAPTLIGCAIVLLGTALATGVLRLPARAAAAAASAGPPASS